MENRLKLGLSRMFRSSFGSCRPRNTSDVIQKPVFVSEDNEKFRLIDSVPPKPRPFPSICKPKLPEAANAVEDSCVVYKDALPRRRVSERRRPIFFSAGFEGRLCPPASPVSPLNPFYRVQELHCRERQKKSKTKKRTDLKKGKKKLSKFSSYSADTANGGMNWLGSDDETETLFSNSRSFSNSDSSESRRARSRRKKNASLRRRAESMNSEMGTLALEGKVKDSFAVVKSSSDPYNDFRTSMVEMIVAKQIFAAKDLEQLLLCFLLLNSSRHHRIIVEVFTDISEALFSNWR